MSLSRTELEDFSGIQWEFEKLQNSGAYLEFLHIDLTEFGLPSYYICSSNNPHTADGKTNLLVS